ncbi:MAG: Asp-tRNA(Asn)/Glu-tRNA(Gln) amidotransferase subunit GatC [Patescibacteria group bacterium]
MEKVITEEEIVNIAKLCKIALEEGDKEKYAQDLSRILDYIKMLAEVDTKSVAPSYQVSDNQNILADDKVEPSLSRAEVLSEAYDKDLVHIRTKGVFDD